MPSQWGDYRVGDMHLLLYYLYSLVGIDVWSTLLGHLGTGATIVLASLHLLVQNISLLAGLPRCM